MTKLSREDFKAFIEACAQHLNSIDKEEYYLTPYDAFMELASDVESSLFSEEIAREARYQEYLKLKEEFEPGLHDSILQDSLQKASK